MATIVHPPAPPAAAGNFREVLKSLGTNDANRAECVGLSRATVRKILNGDISIMLAWLATQPVLAAALLVDALGAAEVDGEVIAAVERQLARAGELLEDAADKILIADLAEQAAAQ